MKFLILITLLSSCTSTHSVKRKTNEPMYRCTSQLEIFENDANMEAVKVLLSEGEIEIQREDEQGLYLTYADPSEEKSKFMVTYYLADRIGEKYIASLLNCFQKNEKIKRRY